MVSRYRKECVCRACGEEFLGYVGGSEPKWCSGCRERQKYTRQRAHRAEYQREYQRRPEVVERMRPYMRDYMRNRRGVVCRPCACEWCAGDVWGQNRIYCSRSCQVAHNKLRAWIRYQAKVLPRTCKMCLVEFEPPNLNKGYCSSACESRAKSCQRRGLSLASFRDMWAAQSGCCAVCRKELVDARLTHVDHCHKTRTPRGILCQNCNLAIGQARDDPKLLRALADYLEQPSLLAVA